MNYVNPVARRRVGAAAIALATFSLAACGGSAASSKSSPTASASASSSASGADGGGAAGLRQLYSDPQVQACLKAAGIAVPTFSARPSGERPSNFPSGTRPSTFPSGARPSGARGSGFDTGQASGELTKIDDALKACGIAVPTFAPRSGAVPPPATASS
jgi:hypothetical protein